MREPRIVRDLPDEEYHADPALSSSGARLLLPPSCPALFKYEQDNSSPSTSAMELGTAYHGIVLTGGDESHIEHIDIHETDSKRAGQPIDSWRTDEAKDRAAAAREAGKVPMLTTELATVRSMALAVLTHPIAGRLIASLTEREISLWWTDPETGVRCRARFDGWADGLIVDLKSARSAEPGQFRRSAAEHGYHQQDAWYRDAAREVLGVDAGFLFVAQEKTPPYLVSVTQLDPADVLLGAARNRRAREVFAECTAAGVWPGYADDDVVTIDLPAWARS